MPDGITNTGSAMPLDATAASTGSASLGRAEITAFQRTLMDAGYSLPRFGADGDFGNETKAALRQFQGDAGLPVTGDLDATTQEYLGALSGGLKKEWLSESSLRDVARGQGTIANGTRGEGARLVQQALKDLGYDIGAAGADGWFGRQSVAATSAFQGANGLPQTGIVDQATLAKLGSAGAAGGAGGTGSTGGTGGTTGTQASGGVTDGAVVDGAEARGIQNPRFESAGLQRVASGRGTIQRGARGDDVETLQRAFMDLGFALPRFGADGGFGAEMETAVKRFQREMELPQTGKVDRATLEALDRVAPPPGKALERYPEYDQIFADGRADMTIGVGYDEHGTTAGTLRQILRNLDQQGFRSIDPSRLSPARREELGLTDDRLTPEAEYFHKRGTDPNTGKEVDYVCRVINPETADPSRVRDIFEQALEQDEIVVYNGHARYGSGPDFDVSTSGEGNLKIQDPYASSSETRAEIANAIGNRRSDLGHVDSPGKYQLVFFQACSTEMYLNAARDQLPGRTNDNTDFVASTIPTLLAAGAGHVNNFMNGILGRQSINEINAANSQNELSWLNHFNEQDQNALKDAQNTFMDNGFLGNRGNRLVDSPN